VSEKAYRVWDAADETETDGVTVKAYWPEDAAQQYADRRFSDSAGEFTEGTVAVQHPDGTVEHFDINSDYEIRFFAERSLEQPGGDA
jgi:hypothetical protein